MKKSPVKRMTNQLFVRIESFSLDENEANKRV